jgi:ketosteroid isomerase-like protein
VSIFGGWGDYEIGWDQVGPRLEWAGARFVEGGSTQQEVLTMASNGDLGYTVSVERGTARLPGRTEPVPMVLRVTHVHRRIDGRWRVVHRHADPITEKTPPEAVLQDHAG